MGLFCPEFNNKWCDFISTPMRRAGDNFAFKFIMHLMYHRVQMYHVVEWSGLLGCPCAELGIPVALVKIFIIFLGRQLDTVSELFDARAHASLRYFSWVWLEMDALPLKGSSHGGGSFWVECSCWLRCFVGCAPPSCWRGRRELGSPDSKVLQSG